MRRTLVPGRGEGADIQNQYFVRCDIASPQYFRAANGGAKKRQMEISKMVTKTKAILAAALILGTASAALAGDQTDERGGYVLPGSTDGVNPAYHPGWFPGYAAQPSTAGNGGAAFGYVATPKKPHHVSRVQSQDR
jgi:hypothetical protein